MLMWISGLQKVLLGRLLGPKFGDLGVQFGDLGAQIEVPEGPLGAVLAIQKPFVASWDIWSSLGGLLEPSGSESPVRKVGLDSPLGAKEFRNSGKEGWTGQAFGSQGAPKFR